MGSIREPRDVATLGAESPGRDRQNAGPGFPRCNRRLRGTRPLRKSLRFVASRRGSRAAPLGADSLRGSLLAGDVDGCAGGDGDDVVVSTIGDVGGDRFRWTNRSANGVQWFQHDLVIAGR